MAGIIELINRQVRQHTNRIGQIVKNLHGATAGRIEELRDAVEQSWLVVEHPARELVPLEEFFHLTGTSPTLTNARLVDAASGQVSVSAASAKLLLLRGVITSDAPAQVPLTVSVPDGSCAIYVNGKRERSTTGAVTVQLTVDAGETLIEVLAHATTLRAELPTFVAIDGTLDTVPTPVWDTVNPGYMDPAMGVPSVRLAWYADPRVGGWRVQRRQAQYVSTVTAVSPADPFGVIGVMIDGDHGTMGAGTELTVRGRGVGTLVSAFYDSTLDETALRIRAAEGVSPDSSWVGGPVAAGSFDERTVVRRTAVAGVVTWDDTSVTTGELYEYRLQAFGAIDALANSGYSDIQGVRAGDTAAPASITLEAGYPISLNRRVTVRFHTPADSDYAGVRVFYRQMLVGTIATASGVNFTLTGVSGLPVDQYAGWEAYFDYGADEGQVILIASNTATQFTLGLTPEEVLTVGQTVRIYLVREVVTDYGVPDTDDELSFAPDGDGTYIFATFDHTGNQQLLSEAASWDYVASDDDAFSVPPIVSIRQLTPTEQVLFAAPYNNPTRWVIVLIDGRNANDSATGVTLFYHRKGEAVQSMSAVTAPLNAGVPHNPAPIDDAGGPPVIVGERVIDNPAGTRSRFVALERTAEPSYIRVWAQSDTGLASGRSQFTVDYNETPQVTSVETTYDEGRLNALGTEGVAEVRIVVDDDTRSFKMWVEPADTGEPTSAAPAIVVDTATSGSVGVLGSIALGAARRKTFKVQPYSGTNLTGTAGDIVSRDLTRPPSSRVVIEDKDEQGRTSAEVVRAGFTMTPAPVVAWPTSGTQTIASVTDTGLAVSGTPWTVDQWAAVAQINRLYVVEVTMVRSGVTYYAYREIVANTTSALTVDLAWPTAGDPLRPIAGDVVRIFTGSIVARVGTPSTSGIAWGDWQNLIPPQALFLSRGPSDERYLEFYAALNGVPLEMPNRVVIDSNNVPSIGSIDLVQVDNKLRITIEDPDDDVKMWHIYARKGPTRTLPGDAEVWPTTNQDPLGTLELKYLRAELSISETSFDLPAGEGCWYVMVVPYNSFNDRAPADTWPRAFLNVDSVAATVPRLTNLRTEDYDEPVNDRYVNRIRWDHENFLEAATNVRVEVAVKAPELGFGTASSYAVLTPLSPGVYATGDFTSYSANLATHLPNTVNDEGSWPMVLTGTPWVRGTVGDLLVTVHYRVRLFVDGSLVESYSWSRQEYWEVPAPEVAAGWLYITGGTAGQQEGAPQPPCFSPETHEVFWNINSPDPTNYYIRIHRSVNAGAFTMVRDSIAGDETSAVFTLTGSYTPEVGGTVTDIQYRIEMRRYSDNVVVSTDDTNIVGIRRSDCQGYEY